MTRESTTVSAQDEEKLDKVDTLSPPLIYEAVRRDGEEELSRPAAALFFSGFAAGLLISASILAEAVIATGTPEGPWKPLVVSIGYALGFVLVILGRMQLFTENTITTVLPFMAEPSARCALRIARLWAIVLMANVAGAAVAAAAFHTGMVPQEFTPALQELSEHAVGMGPAVSFLRAIPAGLIIAALVWMLAHGRSSALAIIVIFVWLIAAADFTHVVAGSVEAAYLVIGADMALNTALLGFFLPTLVGNILGGTLVFSLLAWAQVKRELDTVPQNSQQDPSNA